MTPERQQTVIAEALGFTNIKIDTLESVDIEARSVTYWTGLAGDIKGIRQAVPNYTGSHDAIREAMSILFHCNTQWINFEQELKQVMAAANGWKKDLVPSWRLHATTPGKMAEAVVKTMGLWEAS